MNQSKTLTEIRKELNVSRKAIQGYEKHGLIESSQKDKYGRHIYDEKITERIIKIRFYQKLGFEILAWEDVDFEAANEDCDNCPYRATCNPQAMMLSLGD